MVEWMDLESKEYAETINQMLLDQFAGYERWEEKETFPIIHIRMTENNLNALKTFFELHITSDGDKHKYLIHDIVIQTQDVTRYDTPVLITKNIHNKALYMISFGNHWGWTATRQ